MNRRHHRLGLPLHRANRLFVRIMAVVCLACLSLSTTESMRAEAMAWSFAEPGSYAAVAPSVDDFVLSDPLTRDALGLTAHSLGSSYSSRGNAAIANSAEPPLPIVPTSAAPSPLIRSPIVRSGGLLASGAEAAAPLAAANGAAYEPPPATLVITPAAGVFGSVPVGTKSPVIFFNAQNNTASAVTYTGSSGLGEFIVQPGNCNIVNGELMLAAGASCTFSAIFAPTVPGPVSGSLTITTNSGPVSVPISGTGAGLLITPASATFGNVPVGSTSPVVTFTAHNYAAATASYVNSTGLSEFTLTPGTCHIVNGDPMLAAGGTCTFTASFSPTKSGIASGGLNISTSSGPVFVPISGIGGTTQGLVVVPASGAFGNVPIGTSSPIVTFTATNYSSSTVFYAGATGAQEFVVQPGSCHIVNGDPVLASGQSCAFAAAFKPTAVGLTSGSLSIKTASGPFNFPLSGTGISGTLPVANPGGPYTGLTGQPITFQSAASTAPSGQTITAYTWDFGDGSSGAGVSPAHAYALTGTYSVTLTVTDTGGATSIASTTAKIVAAPNPITIKATATPAPNAAGWNNSPVSVIFTCTSSGSPIVNCPASQTVTTEGANDLVSGIATDANGDTATASVTVNLALTPPVLAVISPSNNAMITLSSGSIGVSGTASSSVASIVYVTCNGLPATLSGANFTCTTALTPGANSIPIVTTDIAGNITKLSLSLTYTVAPSLQILAPTNLGITNLTPVTVNGTVNDPNAKITVDGVAVPQSGGAFSVPVPLVEGLNILTAVATNAGGISTTATIEVTLDTTPPHVLINSPVDGTALTASSVTVTGLANDVVVGTVNLQDLKITVNGIAAQVANRSFSALNVPLALGPNTIQATGIDKAGNGTTTSVIVTRVLPSQPPAPAIGKAVLTNWVNIVSGNNQSGVVGKALSAPIIVSLTDSASHPLGNQTVVFKVSANNGLLSSGGGTPASALPVTTDANGLAQVTWTLGQRAGAGNNTLQISSALAVSPVTVTATGSTGDATQIVVDSGNNQTGVLGQPLPFPFVVDVIDAGHNRVPGVPVVFTVTQGGGSFSGAPILNVTSDSNGRAIAILTDGLQEGINNNVVEASFAVNPGMPAAFAATAKAPGNPSATTISGVVLDNSNRPIQSVTIRLYKTNQGSGNNLPVQVGTPVETDAQGTFIIAPAPVGAFKLMADGGTAAGAIAFPTLEYDIVTVAGNDNTVGMPIYLPALDTVNKVCVDETHGGILTLPQYPGFALNIPAGSATFPGGSRTGCVSATPVNGDKVPMAPGFGQQPRFIVTIQPVGTMFNPPAAMTLPNVDGLAPQSVIEMYSYDHDLAMFVAIGRGTVSPDGSSITSDPGVGVVKAGWHCGGNPNTSGSSGSLGVTLAADKTQATAGTPVTLTASGTPPMDGTYVNWEVVPNPKDPNDNPSAAAFTSQPGCPNQPNCMAQLMGNQIGDVTVRVTFKCTTTGATVMSNLVTISFTIGLKIKEVSFLHGLSIVKDEIGSVTPVMNPIWKSSNAPADNDRAGYVQGKKMGVTVTFTISPVPMVPITKVTIKGTIKDLGNFIKTGVTLTPDANGEVTVDSIAADTALPSGKTKFYNPMTVMWTHMADGKMCPCPDDGSSSNIVYVTLAKPTQLVYLTSLHLAVSSDGASNNKEAIAKSWAFFGNGTGPTDVKGWDGRPFVYYPKGVPFGGCATNILGLLTTFTGGARCGAFAQFFQSVLAMNGIKSTVTTVDPFVDKYMLIKNWTYSTTPTFSGPDAYQWSFVSTGGNEMVPPPDPTKPTQFGDMTSDTGAAGENSATPSEKTHINHAIVCAPDAGVFYDPSYGFTYTGSADFENQALDGYVKQVPMDPPNHYRIRNSKGLNMAMFTPTTCGP